MRLPRIKLLREEGEAVYHCISRTVNGEWLLDDTSKEMLRRQMWLVAEYCGVQVLTYTILDNHFHILVRVPQWSAPSDAELLRRYEVLYPKPTPHQAARLEVIRSQLASDGPDAVAWRLRQMSLMGDVSQYMKLLKQRFSIWFNLTHDRFGTLWAERFKSVLVEHDGRALQAMALYIDLNCIRAGIVSDPKDYRFCGYAEAVGGGERARVGLAYITAVTAWTEVQAHYRESLFGAGPRPREGKASIAQHDARRTRAEAGRLPWTIQLTCRLTYFTDGAVFGTQAFVARHLAAYALKTNRRVGGKPQPMSGDWGNSDLAVMRRVRGG